MNVLLILLIMIRPDLKEDRKVINKTYEIDNPKAMSIIIDNIHGDVEVSASGDNKVYLTLEIQMSANSDELLTQAKSELDLGQILADDSMTFFTKAPFVKRCDGKWGTGYDMREQPEYAFKYLYKVKVPKEVLVVAKTINNGDVRVENVDGPVKASNVNGDVSITNALKVLQASTVNGDVSISFLESPTEDISFNTVNGDFNFELPKDFSAQVFFDSMHGDLYTAFDYRKTSPKIEKSEKNGTFKIGTKSGVEIGSGGPELSFKSINGSVYLRKSK